MPLRRASERAAVQMQRDSLRRMGGRARGQEGTGQRGESDGWNAHGRSQMQGALCTLLQADTGQHGGAYSVPGSVEVSFLFCVSLSRQISSLPFL